jgi:DNA replication protein DnaC
LIGESGTGKSRLLIGLGTAAAQACWRVRYTVASKPVNELTEAADDRQLSRTIARYGRDLLCPNELGSMELDRPAPSCSSRSSPSARTLRCRVQRAVLRLHCPMIAK